MASEKSTKNALHMEKKVSIRVEKPPTLAKKLLDTGKKIILESGRDNYYACGLSFRLSLTKTSG